MFLKAILYRVSLGIIFIISSYLGAETLKQLSSAIAANKMDEVKTLLKDDKLRKQINDCDTFGQTVLHTAVSNNQPEMVRELLAAGADPLVEDARGTNALSLALSQNHIEVIEELLRNNLKDLTVKKQLSKEIDTLYKQTALHQAASKNAYKIVTLLLQAGADPTIPDVFGWTPFAMAVHARGLHSIKAFLKLYPALINPSYRHAVTGLTSLQIAIDGSGYNLELVRALVEECGAEITDEDIHLAQRLEACSVDCRYSGVRQYLEEKKKQCTKARGRSNSEGSLINFLSPRGK